jgi:O-methyltransferase involved in polyketide biosynthesis
MSGTVPSQSSNNLSHPEIDTSVPHSARIYDYWLGGKDNYPVDREMGEQIRAVLPGIVEMAQDQRAFLARVVRHLAGDMGVRQFLDIGTGLPTANNTHQVAQAVAPETRIVYVDNDPLVLTHARALLQGTPEGATEYIDADLRDPDKILRAATGTLDFSQPIAIMLLGIVHHIPDSDQAHAIVDQLLDVVPSGSYLTITHTTSVVTGPAMEEAVRMWNEASPVPIVIRTPEELAGFFARLELLEPGVVQTTQWRPDPSDQGIREVDEYCAVGRKP